jgi:HD-GYP domain-containing protein (c-di-GMP phosphodiesterase class II)
MIKKVLVTQLRPGMYLHELVADWMSHPFVRNRFLLDTQETIDKIIAAGIHEAYIDASRGADVPGAPSAVQVSRQIEGEMRAAARQPLPDVRSSLAEEMVRARKIQVHACEVVRTVMKDVRLGRAIDLEQVEPLVEDITGSLWRNEGALLSLLRIKTHDNYTFMHSVAVCALMVTFCRALKLDRDTTRQAGLGALLHDTGKMNVPEPILNKPGRYTEAEFEVMKRHPRDGYEILLRAPQIGPVPLDIALHHHERMDGKGYPEKLPGAQISLMARMAAIVDVYDAITSVRCYHTAMLPTEALKVMWEWSKFHFDPQLMRAFMSTIGIYPVGTLVRLESGRLAVVIEQHASEVLSPSVKVVFSTKSGLHIAPQILDLSKPYGPGGADRIVKHEDPQDWDIDPMLYLG